MIASATGHQCSPRSAANAPASPGPERLARARSLISLSPWLVWDHFKACLKTLVTRGSAAVLVRAGVRASLRIMTVNLGQARFGRAVRQVRSALTPGAAAPLQVVLSGQVLAVERETLDL